MTEVDSAVLPCRPKERALQTVGLVFFAFGAYFAVGLLLDPARATTLATPLDDWIPFCPEFMWCYSVVYTSSLIPVFTVRCQRLFRRVCASYIAVVVACLICWLAYPVSAAGLRADLSGLELQWFHEWGMCLNYDLDPPLNCFPSLHVAITALASGCAWKAKRAYGILAAAIAMLISVSTCLVKQHFVADVVGGVVMAAVVYGLIVRPYDRGDAPEEAVAYSWRGPAGYATFHASALLALYICYSAGLETWQ